MDNNPSDTSSANQSLAILLLIWGSMLVSALMLVGMILGGVAPTPQPTPESTPTAEQIPVFWGVGALLSVAVLVLRRRIIALFAQRKLQESFPLFVVALALAEAISVLGFVVGFFGNRLAMAPLSIVSILLLISLFPGFLRKKG